MKGWAGVSKRSWRLTPPPGCFIFFASLLSQGPAFGQSLASSSLASSMSGGAQDGAADGGLGGVLRRRSARYYYNEKTGEASWVNPNSL